MKFQRKIKEVLLHRPSPKLIERGAGITMLQKALTPAGKFASRSQKKLAVHGYNHGRRFFRDSGKSVFTNLFSPIEIIYAHRLYPFMLEALGGVAASFDLAGDFLATTEKNWLTTDFCSVHRVFMGVASHGLLPKPRLLMSTSHACDGNLKSFSEIGKFYKRPHLFINVPYTKGRESVAYLAAQLRAVSENIEAISGKKLRARDLDAAFHYANRASRALRDIMELRKHGRPLMYGDEGLGLLLLWGLLMGSRSGAVVSESYRDELVRRKESSYDGVTAAKRVLWLHLKPYYPNSILQLLEHDLGAVIVAEEINQQEWPDLNPDRPWESMAERILTQVWIGQVENRVAMIKKTIQDYRIDGVVHFSHWGCRQSNGAIRIIRDAVVEFGIPFLELDGDLVDPRNYAEGQYRTRLEGFMEVMEGR
jgi:benzoyl-CoA reductase/2-hydroxyglutaryl-CoA dehydratase subunit BcrC/BadD/HgdB